VATASAVAADGSGMNARADDDANLESFLDKLLDVGMLDSDGSAAMWTEYPVSDLARDADTAAKENTFTSAIAHPGELEVAAVVRPPGPRTIPIRVVVS
jgi:hypothetical protein